MGRKIPAKKHRGVKDPIKQQEQRFQSIKHKINAPPTDPDEQPVPRSLQRLFAFQQPRAPADKKPKRPRKANSSRSDGNPVAALKRLPGEAGRAFSLRIAAAVRALHHPADQDYPLDLEDTDTRGEYIAAQRERRQRKTRVARARAAREGGAGAEGGAGVEGGTGAEGAGGAGQQRLRKTQRRALKKKEIMKAKEADIAASRALAARELQFERVSFGDVAHAPPALPAPRRAPLAAAAGAPRPGRRDLLLSSLLGAGGGGAGDPGPAVSTAASAAERARLQAVHAYRALRREQARARARR